LTARWREGISGKDMWMSVEHCDIHTDVVSQDIHSGMMMDAKVIAVAEGDGVVLAWYLLCCWKLSYRVKNIPAIRAIKPILYASLRYILD